MSELSQVWGVTLIGVVFAAAVLTTLRGPPPGDDEEIVEVEVGYRGEAAADEYLAAARFLERMGLEVDRETRFVRPPSTDTFLLLLAPRARLGPLRESLVLDWVELGGVLAMRSRDSLDAGAGSAVAWSVGAGAGGSTVARRRGEGLVVALADGEWLTNRGLSAAGHGQLLWDVVARTGKTKARIVRALEMPGLARVLLAYGWPLLAGGLCAAVCLVLRHGRRFGALAPPPDPEQRGFAEHLRASGALLWRAGCHDQVLAPLRARIHAGIERTRGVLTAEERLVQLRELARVSPYRALVAVKAQLNGTKHDPNRALLDLVALLRNS